MTQTIDTNFNRVQLKAILKWYADIEAPRAHFLISCDICPLPKPFMDTEDENGNVTLNFSWQSTRDMVFFDDGLEFKCRRAGIPYTLYVPFKAIIGFQTDNGFMLFNYMPTTKDFEENEPEVWYDGNSAVKSDYRPSMVRLDIPEAREEIKKQTSDHLKLVHDSRTKKTTDRIDVDPKQQSYPFPEDRFAEYNAKRSTVEKQGNTEEFKFKGTPQGIMFKGRPKPKRVRPDWMVVINGGKQ